MMKENIEAIVSDSGSFGNMNVILCFKEPPTCFEATYNDLVSLFKPDEINCSLFNLDSEEVINILLPTFPVQNSNSIISVIFVKDKEKISIEYYDNQFILEHFFRPSIFKWVKGYSIIQKYHKKKDNSTLIFGFEVEVFSNSYESSLKEILSDKSLHPIFLVKSDIHNSYLIEKYESDRSGVNEQKVKLIKEYMRLIGIISNDDC